MYQITRSKDRYHFQNEWLSTYWHFSFDHYYDAQNISFGPLRVFNDDTVQPGRGFPLHGHKEMEIVTYVLEGELEHTDSTGGHGKIGAGEVQCMTAGTGIRHSEFNASREKPVHLLQIWILPRSPGLEPEYQQQRFLPQQREGVLLPIVSGRRRQAGTAAVANDQGNLTIHQDATFYVSSLAAAQELAFKTSRQRRAYLFIISGRLQAGEEILQQGDIAKISDEESISLKAEERSELMLIDLP